MAESEFDGYEHIGESFYEDQTRSLNPIRSWYHSSRHGLVREIVKRYYSGGKILDVACGNCVWNDQRLPVTGLDVNQGFLDVAFKNGRLKDFIVGKIQSNPFKENSFDLIVCAEFLEHCLDYSPIIQEFNRILKKGGIAVVTVPYDTPLSLWRPLFKVQCFLQGNVLGNDYYKAECGHVNHFSPKTIIESFAKRGFELMEFKNHAYFLIAIVLKKK